MMRTFCFFDILTLEDWFLYLDLILLLGIIFWLCSRAPYVPAHRDTFLPSLKAKKSIWEVYLEFMFVIALRCRHGYQQSKTFEI